MFITSKVDRVTLFPRGAEITRLADIDLNEGEHELVLRDLPVGLVDNSLRVEGRASGVLELGAVDSRTVHIPPDEKSLDQSERHQLEKQLEQLEDEARAIDGRLETALTQKKLMDNLAAMPAQAGTSRKHETDWGALFDLIGDRLPKSHKDINLAEIERRELQEKMDDLRKQLDDEPAEPKTRTEVKISAKTDGASTGQLTIRYQILNAGWQPLYDARLNTGSNDSDPVLDLVRRAQIHQNSVESWDDIDLTLSTTRPSGGTSAPDLTSQFLDILPDHPAKPMSSRGMNLKMAMAPPAEVAGEMMADEAPEDMLFAAVEQQAHVEQSTFQATFKVPGRISLSGRVAGASRGVQKKVRLGGQSLKPRLEIRSTPMLDPTCYLHADFKLEEGLSLLPGPVALYRDNIYVGNGHLPLINVGEHYELGFGADDAVTIKRTELKRSKGTHGLIKTENTDEFHFRIIVNNHHSAALPVRILDRIPASNHEKLNVEMLKGMTEPTRIDVKDKRGVLAFEQELSAGGEIVINIHYRVSWPRDERIG